MSTKENAVSVVSAVSAVFTNVHAEFAQARLQELHAMRDQIPHFVIPMSPKDTVRLNSVASVPPELIELTAVAITNQKSLVRGDGATAAEIRDYMSYADAYLPLADELEAFAQFIRHSATAARNKAGFEALMTYAVAQRLAKRPENAGLATLVADMRRALGRARKTVKAAQPAPAPQPQPK